MSRIHDINVHSVVIGTVVQLAIFRKKMVRIVLRSLKIQTLIMDGSGSDDPVGTLVMRKDLHSQSLC